MASNNANLKNGQSVLMFPVNALTADGALNKTIEAKIFGHDVVRLTSEEFARGFVQKHQTVFLDGGRIHIDGLDCRTPEGRVTQVSAVCRTPMPREVLKNRYGQPTHTTNVVPRRSSPKNSANKGSANGRSK